MISYQPALDRYHTIFRMLALVDCTSSCLPIEVDKIRMLDFYLAFPFRLEAFKVKQAHTAIKKVGKAYRSERPYGGIPDDMSLFLRMAPVQTLAMDTLAAHDFIGPDAYKKGVIIRGDTELPDQVTESIAAYLADRSILFEAVRILACDYVLLGDDGLKRRSGLMEHKYDAA